jgi:nucleotide-binding universal stress UspA family protein
MQERDPEATNMIRTILLALDQSPTTRRSSTELGITWAKRFNAELTGVAIVDAPWTYPMLSTGVGAATHGRSRASLERIARESATTMLDEFRERCNAAEVKQRTRCETGDPVQVLLALHEDCDVTLLAQHARYRFLTPDEPDEVLTEVLRRSSKPVVAVPETIPARSEVLVAYDGSPAAHDALRSFAESQLGIDRPVTVVCAAEDEAAAARCADEAARFLDYHDVKATVHPIVSKTRDADILAALAQSHSAGMMVMGAFAHGRLREWYRPSLTTRMLATGERLLYLHHHPE